MQKVILLSFLFLISIVFSAEATVGTRTAETAAEKVELSPRQQRKAQRKQASLQKRVDRFKQKMEKRSKKAPYSVFDNSKFRVGALLLLIAIGLAIVAAIGLLSSLMSLLASLFALGGVVMLVWGLIEFYG